MKIVEDALHSGIPSVPDTDAFIAGARDDPSAIMGDGEGGDNTLLNERRELDEKQKKRKGRTNFVS
jgi:hypothetical protein